jgi:hypothetical protein
MSTELDKAREALAEAGDTDMDNLGHLRVALTEVDRLTAALAEAEATIANEHGDGPAPAEGWQWITTSSMQGMWRRETNDNDQMVQRLMGRGWYWTDWEHPFHPDNVRPTARAAMRAATSAAKEQG